MAKIKKKSKIINLTIAILVDGNEDPNLLRNAIRSAEFATEIIKIDTTKIKGSFSQWRNAAINLSKCQWILYVDSDETISSSLAEEIKLIIKSDDLSVKAYAIPRKNIIFGREFKHSGQYPDYQIRLFKRLDLKGWFGDLHEQPEYEGRLGYLKNSLIHNKNITIGEMLEKTNKWSEIEGQLMFEAHHPKMNIVRFTTAGLREFWKRFIIEKAFLDGKEGIIYGVYQIYSKLISYSKLWEKQQSTIHI